MKKTKYLAGDLRKLAKDITQKFHELDFEEGEKNFKWSEGQEMQIKIYRRKNLLVVESYNTDNRDLDLIQFLDKIEELPRNIHYKPYEKGKRVNSMFEIPYRV